MSEVGAVIDKTELPSKKETKAKPKSKWSIKNVYLLMFVWIGVNTLWAIRNIVNYLLFMVGQFLSDIPMFIPFGNPLYPSLIGLIAFSVSTIFMWLVFTKLDDKYVGEILSLPIRGKKLGEKRVLFLFKRLNDMKFISKIQKERQYLRLFVFLLTVLGIASYFLWYITAPVYLHVVPFFLQHIATVELSDPLAIVLVGNPSNLLRMFMFIPFVVLALTSILLWGQYAKYRQSFNEAFIEYEFSNLWLQKQINRNDILSLDKEEMRYPDVVLGPNSKSKELVIQPGKDRTLNNIIVGSIGTGKTAALVLPLINQDLHWMTRFINHFPSIYEREDYKTDKVQGMYLNGISVIEPSNDLCQKAFNLVKAHGIPEESVFYIDPTNPNTPSINVMQGPVDKVAEAFAMVIEGLAEGGQGNFFFQQSERNHLKHYIYLLKLHKGENEYDDDATFDKLLDMYNNAQLVRRLHLKLKETLPEGNINDIEDRDERNHWKIVQQIDEWFDNSLLPKTSRNGTVEKVRSGKYRGEEEYFDAKAEYVQGLRNILNDIGASKLLRRVLFGKSDFNMDRHLEYGGVLLCNTAKGELGELSNVLGKLVLLSLQNAVFRRKPDVSTFHHIIVDEFPDYIYQPFKEFPAQSRKYKTIVTVVCQTITQLADKYGTTYMHTLLGTLRHKLVYGDIPQFDAELFSKSFGEKEHYEEGTQEQEVSPLQEDPTLRVGSSYTRTKDVIMTPADIMFQKEFQAAVKIVKDNRPMPVVQIDANFVPFEQFDEAIVVVEEDSGKLWLEERNKHLLAPAYALEESVLEELQKEEQLANEVEGAEQEEVVSEVNDDIPMKSYPREYEADAIDDEVESVVHFPKVVSYDDEVEDVIKDLQMEFNSVEVPNEAVESPVVEDVPIIAEEEKQPAPAPESISTPESSPAPDTALSEQLEDERYRAEQERIRRENDREYHAEQERLSRSTQEQQMKQKQMVNRNMVENTQFGDLMNDFGVSDANDD